MARLSPSPRVFAPTCIATLCYLLFPPLYGIYHFSIAHFIASYLPLLPDAALSCTFYAAFGTAMGFVGLAGLLARSPVMLLVFAHHLLLDAVVSVVPSVMALDLVRRAMADICESGEEMGWCGYGVVGAGVGFGLGAVAVVVARICIALATRQAALELEALERSRDVVRVDMEKGRLPG